MSGLNAYALKNNVFIERDDELEKLAVCKTDKEALQIAVSICYFNQLLEYTKNSMNLQCLNCTDDFCYDCSIIDVKNVLDKIIKQLE